MLFRSERPPCVAKRFPVDRVGTICVVTATDDGGAGLSECSQTVEPAESLSKRIQRCTFRDQTLEIQIDAHFERLCGNHHQITIRGRSRSTRCRATENTCSHSIAVQRTAASDHEFNVVLFRT